MLTISTDGVVEHRVESLLKTKSITPFQEYSAHQVVAFETIQYPLTEKCERVSQRCEIKWCEKLPAQQYTNSQPINFIPLANGVKMGEFWNCLTVVNQQSVDESVS